MKKIFLILLTVAFIGCKKEQDFKAAEFPGYSGKGDYATWTVFRHTVTNSGYLTTALPAQTPPTTLTAYDASLVSARYREVSPFTIRLYKSGEVATVVKDAQNKDVWQKQTNLKWEINGDFMDIYRNTGGVWVSVMQCNADLQNLLCKFRRAYYGDTGAAKDEFVLEVLYTFYNLN